VTRPAHPSTTATIRNGAPARGSEPTGRKPTAADHWPAWTDAERWTLATDPPPDGPAEGSPEPL
jgi:hypothetical protein